MRLESAAAFSWPGQTRVGKPGFGGPFDVDGSHRAVRPPAGQWQVEPEHTVLGEDTPVVMRPDPRQRISPLNGFRVGIHPVATAPGRPGDYRFREARAGDPSPSAAAALGPCRRSLPGARASNWPELSAGCASGSLAVPCREHAGSIAVVEGGGAESRARDGNARCRVRRLRRRREAGSPDGSGYAADSGVGPGVATTTGPGVRCGTCGCRAEGRVGHV